MTRERKLTRQLVVRVDAQLEQELKEAAETNGRTVAQEVRLRLRRALGLS